MSKLAIALSVAGRPGAGPPGLTGVGVPPGAALLTDQQWDVAPPQGPARDAQGWARYDGNLIVVPDSGGAFGPSNALRVRYTPNTKGGTDPGSFGYKRPPGLFYPKIFHEIWMNMDLHFTQECRHLQSGTIGRVAGIKLLFQHGPYRSGPARNFSYLNLCGSVDYRIGVNVSGPVNAEMPKGLSANHLAPKSAFTWGQPGDPTNRGRYIKVGWGIEVNTLGNADGRLTLYVDDRLVWQTADVRFFYPSQIPLGYNEFELSPTFGGAPSTPVNGIATDPHDWRPLADQDLKIDRWRIHVLP